MARVQERAFERKRLFLIDIQTDTGDPAFVDHPGEVGFDGDAASAGVHQIRRGFHEA